MYRKLSVAEIEDSTTMLPTFPQVVLDLLSAVGDDAAGRQVMTDFLKRDPISAGRVLPAATPAHGRHAVLALASDGSGRPWLRETILISTLADFASQLGCGNDFLEHGLAVGIYAQELSQRCGLNREFALVAGLLHDIGQGWMACCHPGAYRRIPELVTLSGRTTCEVEREVFGMDHGEVGYCAGRAWGLPTPILDAIAQHHRPRGRTANCLVAATHLADLYSHGPDIACGNRDPSGAVSVAAARALGITPGTDVGSLLGRMDARVHQARAHLH